MNTHVTMIEFTHLYDDMLRNEIWPPSARTAKTDKTMKLPRGEFESVTQMLPTAIGKDQRRGSI